MSDNNKKKEKFMNSAAGESLGAIIFTLVIGLLMWLASKWFL